MIQKRVAALALAVSLALPGASQAASPEENYVAARNAHIKSLAAATKRKAPEKEIAAQHRRAQTDLERQVRRLVGTTVLKGVSPTPQSNLQGLLEGELDYGMLDGLLYTSADSRTRIVVTTQNLLKNWLRENRNVTIDGERMPEGMAQALRWPPFYTRALGGGAAVGGFAEIPVGADAGFATALLVARAQDIGPRNPDELIVALIRGHKVFIVSAETTASVMPIPDCEALWPALKEKGDTAFETYRLSGMKDRNVLDRHRKAEDETDAAYRRCFAERAPRDVNYKKIIAQAQAIVDALPAK